MEGGLRRQFDRREAWSREAWSRRRALAAGASRRASRRASTGFWRASGSAQLCQDVRKAATHAGRGPPLGRQGRLPGEAHITDRVARQAQLDVGEDEQPGPAVSGGRGAQFGRRPLERLLERLLEDAERMLNREPGGVRAPDLGQIRPVRSRPPERTRVEWALWWGAGGARPRAGSASHGAAVAVDVCRAWRGSVEPHAGRPTRAA